MKHQHQPVTPPREWNEEERRFAYAIDRLFDDLFRRIGKLSEIVEEQGESESVTGVKGDTESDYRTGLVNITAENVGAAGNAHTHTAGDVTAGTLDSDRLPESGVTAGNYGPNADASPAKGETFSVPYITFDGKGRATAASTKSITMPTDDFSATLLWENENPTAAFVAQEIELVLSDYNGVVIEYLSTPNTSPITSRAIPVYCGDKLIFVDDQTGNYYGTRKVYIGSDRVKFWSGKQGTTQNDSRAIPMAIYGVKNAASPKTEAVAGRTYLVKRFDPEGGLVSGFRCSMQQNGNAPDICSWIYSDAGTGFCLITDTNINAFCTMASRETIDLTNYDTLTIDASCITWAGTNGNCVGLIAKSTMEELGDDFDTAVYQNTVQAGWFAAKTTVTNTAETCTRNTVTFDVSGITGEYHLAAMVTGAGYTATMCILEAYLT